MNTYQIVTLCWSIGSAVVGFLVTYCISVRKRNKALAKGIQALLRAQMISDYNKWTAKGYAPIYARENFQNCWVQYEALGENGVMNDIHDKFLALPTPQDNE